MTETRIPNLKADKFQSYLKENKVVEIHNWFEPYSVTDYPKNKKLVTVGRFDHQKGYDYLVKTAKKVLSDKSDWTW